MSVTTHIDDPRSFDRSTVGLLAGGLAAGATTAVLATIFSASTVGLGALAFGVVVGLVTYLVDDTEDDAIIGLLLCIGGGIVLAAGLGAGMASVGWVATGVAGALVGLGAGARHFAGRKPAFWAVISGLSLLAARFTTLELLSPERLAAFDSMAVQQLLSSGIWGLFLAGAVGTGFVRLDRDEILAKINRARSSAVAPVDGYLESASELYSKIAGEADRGTTSDLDARARAIAEETIDSLTEFSLRYSDLREGMSGDKARVLRERADALDARIEGARSPKLAAQLEKTQEEVLGQLDMQEELELACARLESRGQRCVTMLERLHVTLVQNASGELENAALNEAFEELEHLADEVQMKSLSVEQLLAEVEDDEAGEVEAPREVATVTSDDATAEVDAPVTSVAGSGGHDGSLDDGTDGATLQGAECQSPDASSDDDEAPQEQERDDVVRAEHQSC